MNSLKAFLLTSSLLLPISANAATYYPNDVILTYSGGAAGTWGNGLLVVSQKYTFAPGDVIDFGTAVAYGDPPDLRYGPCGLTSRCYASGGYTVFFLKDGAGGIDQPTDPFSGNGDFPYTGIFDSPCSPDGNTCSPAVFALVVTIPNDKNGVQLGFVGGGYLGGTTHLVPAVVSNPVPAALPMFAAGLGLLGWFSRRRRYS